jgi:hypothetical protein
MWAEISIPSAIVVASFLLRKTLFSFARAIRTSGISVIHIEFKGNEKRDQIKK